MFNMDSDPRRWRSLEISALAFLTGFFSLCIQVIATHYAFLAHPQSSYAIGLSLFSFLTGLGVASALASRAQAWLLARFPAVVAWVFTGTASYFLLTAYLSDHLRMGARFVSLMGTANPDVQHLGAITLLSIVLLFVPALALGLLFPLLNDRRTQDEPVSTGKVGLFDYAGAGAGSLICAFVLVPRLGLGLASVAIGSTMIAVSIPWHVGWKRMPIALAALLPPLLPLMGGDQTRANRLWTYSPPEAVYSQPSPYGEVAVLRRRTAPYDLRLTIGLRTMCWSKQHKSESLLAQAPLDLIRRQELKVLNIGLGCGFTAAEMRDNGRVRELDIAEINPAVVEASRLFPHNLFTPRDGFRLNIFNTEGYEHVRGTAKEYDLIVVDVEEPSIIHSSALFTRDFFDAAARRLPPDGLFALWSFYEPDTGRIILNTLKKAFRSADVMAVNGYLIFLASQMPVNLSAFNQDWARRKGLIERPRLEIATIQDNPYPRYFKVNETFGLPAWYHDPLEITH